MKFRIGLGLLWLTLGCHRGGETHDKIFSQRLHRDVELKILHTPDASKSVGLNLLILNDGQDLDSLGVASALDSLYRLDLLKPMVIVGVVAADRMQEYGVAGSPDYEGRGSKAGDYDGFIHDELYPYAKKMSGVRKFQKFTIAGWSLGGLSAMDIAWNHPDKIDQVGAFSGSFWWRDLASSDSGYSDEKNRILYAKIKSSRKRPHLKYWIYAGGQEETSDRDRDGIIDAVDDAKDMVDMIRSKKICPEEDVFWKYDSLGKHDFSSWKKIFPEFLLWCDGK